MVAVHFSELDPLVFDCVGCDCEPPLPPLPPDVVVGCVKWDVVKLFFAMPKLCGRLSTPRAGSIFPSFFTGIFDMYSSSNHDFEEQT